MINRAKEMALVVYDATLQAGPSFARVDKVEYDYTDVSGNYDSFEILKDDHYLKDQFKAYRHFARGLIQSKH